MAAPLPPRLRTPATPLRMVQRRGSWGASESDREKYRRMDYYARSQVLDGINDIVASTREQRLTADEWDRRLNYLFDTQLEAVQGTPAEEPFRMWYEQERKSQLAPFTERDRQRQLIQSKQWAENYRDHTMARIPMFVHRMIDGTPVEANAAYTSMQSEWDVLLTLNDDLETLDARRSAYRQKVKASLNNQALQVYLFKHARTEDTEAFETAIRKVEHGEAWMSMERTKGAPAFGRGVEREVRNSIVALARQEHERWLKRRAAQLDRAVEEKKQEGLLQLADLWERGTELDGDGNLVMDGQQLNLEGGDLAGRHHGLAPKVAQLYAFRATMMDTRAEEQEAELAASQSALRLEAEYTSEIFTAGFSGELDAVFEKVVADRNELFLAGVQVEGPTGLLSQLTSRRAQLKEMEARESKEFMQRYNTAKKVIVRSALATAGWTEGIDFTEARPEQVAAIYRLGELISLEVAQAGISQPSAMMPFKDLLVLLAGANEYYPDGTVPSWETRTEDHQARIEKAVEALELVQHMPEVTDRDIFALIDVPRYEDLVYTDADGKDTGMVHMVFSLAQLYTRDRDRGMEHQEALNNGARYMRELLKYRAYSKMLRERKSYTQARAELEKN